MAKGKSKIFELPDEKTIELIKNTAHANKVIREQAALEFAAAIQGPIREAVFAGDNIKDVFVPTPWPKDAEVKIPLDIIAPGEEDEYTAWTCPAAGYIPEKQVRGQYVTLQTYKIANSIGWELEFAENAVLNVVARAINAMKAGFVKKMNNDAWHVLLAAVVDRNILVYDADATAGVFTKRLLSLAKITMARQAGGNGLNGTPGRLTDVFMSLEGVEDIRNWNIDQVDDETRRQIYVASDDSTVITRVFGVDLHPMYEFGDGQEYQNYFENVLGGAIQGSDEELAVGLDLQDAENTFVMPVKMPVTIFHDDNKHRSQEDGYYGWSKLGFGIMDSRKVIGLSF